MHPPSGSRRWLVPYLGALFVLLHLVVSLGRARSTMQDPGIGWHLATGRLMLETGALPRGDPFSFTAAGHPWINYYWLFEMASAVLERLGGLPLFATVWTLVYGLIPFVVYRNAVRAGASPLAALPATLLAYVVLLSHAFARPHAVTYVLFAVLVGCIDDVAHDRRSLRSLWWLLPLAAVWANVHGGFITGLWAVAMAAVATGARSVVLHDARDGRLALAFAGLFVAMAAASLANPWGYHLHVQTIEHLNLPSTGYFTEFRSPDFHDAEASVKGFEILLLVLFPLTALGGLRLGWIEGALVLGTLHLALTAVRNMSLFAIVAAPLVARGLTSLAAERWPRIDARWRVIAAEQDAGGGARVQVAVLALVWIALAVGGRLPFPRTLDDLQLTSGAAAYVDAHPERFARAFNQDTLGGALIYRFWPKVHVFVDDRSTVVYGEDFMMDDYLRVLRGRAGWDAVLERWGITTAIVSPATPCATLLRASAEWRVDYADDRNVIFSRIDAAPGA